MAGVAYANGLFVAVVAAGVASLSSDITNWMESATATTNNLNGLAFGNGYYWAAGGNSTALTSPDGIIWTPRNLGATGGQSYCGTAFLNHRFPVVGTGGTILESAVIAPRFDVQVHRDGKWLTAFVPPGTNFRIQTCTNLFAPVWTAAATLPSAFVITQWTNSATGIKQQFYRTISP